MAQQVFWATFYSKIAQHSIPYFCYICGLSQDHLMRKYLLACIACFFALTSITAQSTVRGTVFDKDTGEPIGFCNVFIEESNQGTNTDINGFYSINRIEPGSYTLMATFVGYDTTRVSIDLKPGQVINKQLFLKESAIQLGAVSISADKVAARNEVKISRLSVSPKQISMLPSTGGEPDIVQYLQVIPGVVSTGDAGGQIFIRGGSPVQNKILLDGLTIFNPFHSIGFFSTFETDAIRNVDVLTGGFNADHGGRISAIVDINTRDGNKKKLSGAVSASPFLAKLFIEAPIIKQTEQGGSTSVMFSQKYSFIDRTGAKLYKHAAINDSIGLPYRLNDTYGKISFINQNGSSLSIFGFNYLDQYNNPAVANIGWSNAGGGTNFKLLIPNSKIVINGLVGYTSYKIGFQDQEESNNRQSSVGSFVGCFDFDYYFPKGSFKYGVEVNVLNTDFSFKNPFGYTLNEKQSSPDIAGFGKFRYKLGSLIIEPGFRAIYYAALKEFSPEPRLGLKWNISDNLRFKAAAGMYSQNLLSTSNERDVVALFTGFLTAPASQISKLGTKSKTTSNLQKSIHALGGIEIDLMNNLSMNIEGYWKNFNQLIVVNRNKTRQDIPNYTTEEGVAYGGDITLKYQLPSLYLWGTYALGYVNRNDGTQIFPTIFDRRHNVNLMANYQFSHDKSWELGLRWNYGSGFPFTQTSAFYNQIGFKDGENTNIITENPNEVGILYSKKRNGGRLPSYHRMDVSLIKRIKFANEHTLEMNASVTNAYNRGNIFYFNRVTYSRVNQLPILPSFSLKYKF